MTSDVTRTLTRGQLFDFHDLCEEHSVLDEGVEYVVVTPDIVSHLEQLATAIENILGKGSAQALRVLFSERIIPPEKRRVEAVLTFLRDAIDAHELKKIGFNKHNLSIYFEPVLPSDPLPKGAQKILGLLGAVAFHEGWLSGLKGLLLSLRIIDDYDQLHVFIADTFEPYPDIEACKKGLFLETHDPSFAPWESIDRSMLEGYIEDFLTELTGKFEVGSALIKLFWVAGVLRNLNFLVDGEALKEFTFISTSNASEMSLR